MVRISKNMGIMVVVIKIFVNVFGVCVWFVIYLNLFRISSGIIFFRVILNLKKKLIIVYMSLFIFFLVLYFLYFIVLGMSVYIYFLVVRFLVVVINWKKSMRYILFGGINSKVKRLIIFSNNV